MSYIVFNNLSAIEHKLVYEQGWPDEARFPWLGWNQPISRQISGSAEINRQRTSLEEKENLSTSSPRSEDTVGGDQNGPRSFCVLTVQPRAKRPGGCCCYLVGF